MTPPTVQRLRVAAAGLRDERVSMQALAQAHGPEAHGTLLLMAMPCLLPVPGVGTVLGLGMAALAAAMWRGHSATCLPATAGGRTRTVASLWRRGGPRAGDGVAGAVRHNGPDAVGRGLGQPVDLRPGFDMNLNGLNHLL